MTASLHLPHYPDPKNEFVIITGLENRDNVLAETSDAKKKKKQIFLCLFILFIIYGLTRIFCGILHYHRENQEIKWVTVERYTLTPIEIPTIQGNHMNYFILNLIEKSHPTTISSRISWNNQIDLDRIRNSFFKFHQLHKLPQLHKLHQLNNNHFETEKNSDEFSMKPENNNNLNIKT